MKYFERSGLPSGTLPRISLLAILLFTSSCSPQEKHFSGPIPNHSPREELGAVASYCLDRYLERREGDGETSYTCRLGDWFFFYTERSISPPRILGRKNLSFDISHDQAAIEFLDYGLDGFTLQEQGTYLSLGLPLQSSLGNYHVYTAKGGAHFNPSFSDSTLGQIRTANALLELLLPRPLMVSPTKTDG